MASSALVLLIAVLAAATAAPTATAPSPSTTAAEEDPLQKLAPAVLKVARECLSKEYNALACWKLFLVRRADGFIGDVRTSEVKHQGGTASFELLPGFVALEKDARRQDNEVLDDLEDVGGMEAKDDVQGQDLAEDNDLQDPGRDQESLDRALIARTNKLFSGRHVSVKVLPGVALKVSPRMGKDQSSLDADVSVEVGPGEFRGHGKSISAGCLPGATATGTDSTVWRRAWTQSQEGRHGRQNTLKGLESLRTALGTQEADQRWRGLALV